MTGLDLEKDRIIEVAAIRFTFSEILKEYESLVDPECPIPETSLAIHHINSAMLFGKPKIDEVLSPLLDVIGDHIIIGHGIGHDIQLVTLAARRAKVPCKIIMNPFIDTLRLARHYGDSPVNSLQQLASHFNVPIDETHRAMADVKMNIAVFKYLAGRFKTTEQLFNILAQPIKMKYMPLGKYKGRLFSEIPLDYLQWSLKMDFDQDLRYTINLEINERKKGGKFSQATNPFSQL